MGQVRYRGQGAKMTLIILFKMIWASSNKRSFISGMHLRHLQGTDFFLNCFSHVLAKGQNKYPHFRLYAKNIRLLTDHEHHLLDHGSEEQRINYALDIEEKTGGKSTCDWQKLYDLRDELIKEYKEVFPSTFLGILNYKYSPDEVIAKVGALNKKFFEGN